MNPETYSCSIVGGFFKFRTILYLIILGVVGYYGWPVIEALIILLPIPDPKHMLEKLKSLISSSVQAVARSTKSGAAASGPGKKGPYARDFD